MSYNFRNKATTLKMNAMNKLPRSRTFEVLSENFLSRSKATVILPQSDYIIIATKVYNYILEFSF